MRTELIAYLTANLTGSIACSQELPYEEGINPLYKKNMRRVYLDEPNWEVTQLLGTMCGAGGINQKITTIRAFLTMDAKNRNADLDAALETLSSAKDITTITRVFRREFDYITTIENDKITFEMEYRFYGLA